MNIISQKIDNIFLLPAEEKRLLLSQLERVEAHKHELLIAADKVERYVYFIEKGIARAFCQTDKQQTTIWFGEEGDVMLSFFSFFNNKPGYETIEVLEDSILYRISSHVLQELYHHHIHIANWGRKFAEQELLKTEQRFMDLQFKTATQRYQELLASSSSVLRRVQLGYIASFLGITQVSLSRIRATAK